MSDAKFMWIMLCDYKESARFARFATALSIEDADRLVLDLVEREGIDLNHTFRGIPEIVNQLLFQGCYKGPPQLTRYYNSTGQLTSELAPWQNTSAISESVMLLKSKE